ncbi:MAG: Sec-independent protein translocase protein TatB [Gammaproteobacteria bacterium]|nr:Sec-independent protein translocase protein TatB [Gammaproteobacteria bacterium]MBU1647012.1 Sec-independent protein translocase protein TatB [Gammaproteobacteria bacterium]MBU1972524.1 Sec-independent protein translocase protein TatB [Gammaproteobacteria bacterium]
MFDVGFSQLILIGLVALIVIGPQRLPSVARTVGHLLGRLQRYVGDVKADISREMQLEELKKLQDQVASQARDMERQVTEQMSSVETDLNASIAQGIEAKAEQAAPQESEAAIPPPAADSMPEVATAVPPTTDKPAA